MRGPGSQPFPDRRRTHDSYRVTPQCLEFPRLARPEAGHPGQGDHAGEAVRRGYPHLLCTLPRSRHRPVAVTEGSLTKNLNRIGVRLWTDSSLP